LLCSHIMASVHGCYRLTTTLLCVPFIFVHHEKCLFSGRHVMASIKSSVIFIVATLITKVLFKQFLFVLLHNGLKITGNEAFSFQTINTQVKCVLRFFRFNMNGFTSNNKAVPLYCIFHNHIHIVACSNQGARGLQPL